MSKEINKIEIQKHIKLTTFRPKKGETIFVTIPPWEYDIEQAQMIFKAVQELFPDNNVMLKFDGITIESMMEDDLK